MRLKRTEAVVKLAWMLEGARGTGFWFRESLCVARLRCLALFYLYKVWIARSLGTCSVAGAGGGHRLVIYKYQVEGVTFGTTGAATLQ